MEILSYIILIAITISFGVVAVASVFMRKPPYEVDEDGKVVENNNINNN